MVADDSGLKVEVFYLECLAQASYLICHEGKAFMVDPRRDVEPFFEVSGNGKTPGDFKLVLELVQVGSKLGSKLFWVGSLVQICSKHGHFPSSPLPPPSGAEV